MRLFVFTFSVLAVICSQNAAGDSIIPPPPGTQCVSPNGQGLGKAIRQLVDLLPIPDLLTIYIRAVTEDQEVKNAILFIESPAFQKIIVTMHNKPEFSDVMEYLCEELHFDAYYYLNSLGGLFNFPPMTRPPPRNRHPREVRVQRRPGFEGMLLDFKDAIPIEKIRETYRRLYKEDEYLRLAMAKIGSDEFRRIGDAIEALPEYQDMLQRLRDIKVPVDKILNALMDFFNWHPRKH
uniref:Venom polypeptide n=1 Tax=Dolopus genitalis TaxID=2488630 RepID=A0A3G5BIN9_DOLGE|nr:venom polypeptide [Dolopus genitalis]